MKLLEIIQLLTVATSQKVLLKCFENEGTGDNFQELTLEKSQILKFQLSRKKGAEVG